MLYKFKSQATGELIMLQEPAQRILGVLGKDSHEPGIITVEQLDDAIAKVLAACDAEEAQQKKLIEEAKAHNLPKPTFPPETLRKRSLTFINMMRECKAAEAAITWGV